MKERPILFSAPMVRAILDGSKTQTRRVVKNLDLISGDHSAGEEPGFQDEYGDYHLTKTQCPYGQPGDRLWVRETWALPDMYDDLSPLGVQHRKDVNFETAKKFVSFKADPTPRNHTGTGPATPGKWRPSIHMPRWASRILLEVVDVKVERVQEISEEDAACEGLRKDGAAYLYANEALNKLGQRSPTARWAFQELWDSINAPRGFGWEANPWVWAITFKRIKP